MDDLQAKLDCANDRIRVLETQRNNVFASALNECAAISVQLMAAQRRIQELEAKAKPAKNGHDHEAAEAHAGAAA